MPELEEKLKAFAFARCYNSFIINLSYIKALKRTQITLTNHVDIPISQAYSENIKRAFARFMGEKL